jgi:hypothetical protein
LQRNRSERGEGGFFEVHRVFKTDGEVFWDGDDFSMNGMGRSATGDALAY